MKVISRDEGALSELKKKIEESPFLVKRSSKPPKKVRFQPSEDFSEEDDFLTSPSKSSKPIPVSKPKLNSKDMFFLFSRLWRENNFTGNCTTWTIKERSHIKNMIAEQGEEAVTTYIKYCLQNWKELCHRYKIMSVCPTVSILYGYRRSLLPEALDPAKKPTFGGAEYTETDIPSGSWG